jgi:hypothetical protein
VCENDPDHGEPTVTYLVGQNERSVPVCAVRVLDAGDHRLRVGRRQIR